MISDRCREIPILKYGEFKRWLQKQGARFAPGKGSHRVVTARQPLPVPSAPAAPPDGASLGLGVRELGVYQA